MRVWLAALALAAGPAASGPPVCVGHLCQPEALAPFLDKLRALSRVSGGTVHILQIGDSHTAGDMISQAWRARLQARWGDGGRGVLPAGRPYPGYLTWGVTAAQSPGWTVNATFGAAASSGGVPLGLSGFTQTARTPGESLSLTADTPGRPFDRMIVCAIGVPGGGTVRLRFGEAEARWPLDFTAPTPTCLTLDSDTPSPTASLTLVEAGPVSVTSFGVFRRHGVVLSNLGVSGAQLAHFARADDGVVAAELETYRPDLIVLAFGTNEGFSPTLSPDAYEATLRAQVARIRALDGRNTPILLLGAPDAAGAEARLALPRSGCGDGWAVPLLLGAVRERQRAVARDLGLAFWDWSTAMGGRCAASAWRRDGLMRGDHVHFTREGGERIGALIDADILHALGAEN